MLRRGVTWEGHKVESEPDAIRSIHADYIRAGADVISTNTFQLARRSYANHFADAEHMRHVGAQDIPTRAPLLIREAVKRALEAREQSRQDGVAIAGAMTTLDWCFRPDMAPSAEDMRGEYSENIAAFKDAGVDLMLFETFNSSKEARTAVEDLDSPHVRPWDFMKRPMRGMFAVRAQGCAGQLAVNRWVGLALKHALSLPAK